MKVLRSSFVAAAAIFAAACGDKVEIVQPGPTTSTPTVNSVTVSPSSVTLSVGQTLTFTAVVDVSNGAATTVTWNTTVTGLTVSAAGALSAVPASAAGNSGSVCATSTADATKKGCAQVVITAAQANVPAQVSIQSITSGGNLNTPVNPLAVVGQIDVRVNIVPGTQTPTRLDLLLGTDIVASQIFSAAQAASLRFAADEAAETQSAFPQILFNVNTAAINPTTFAAMYLNGAKTLSARLTTSGSSTTPTATAQTQLTLANVDGYWVTNFATSGTTANALSSTGFRYDRGGLEVSLVPVLYTGRSVAAATVFFGSGCDASAAATGQRNTALVAPATGTSAWTKSWPAATPSGSAQVNFLTNYEFGAATSAACTTASALGESITVTATDANGDALFAAAAPLNVVAVTSIRLDNNAPRAGSPAFMANPNGRQNGWINGGVALNGSSGTMSATSNNWLFSAPSIVVGLATTRDFGQGTYTRFVRIANATGTLVDDARAATASSTATLPAPSLTNGTYCAIATAQDALGNETARPAAGSVCNPPVVASNTAANTGLNHQQFGVDIAAPTIALLNSTDLAGSLNINERRPTTPITNNFNVTVSDTGTVGNSGMLSGSSVLGTVILRNDAASPAVTAANRCVVGVIDGNDGVTCLSASVNAAPAFPVVSVAPTGANSLGAVVPGATAVTAQTTAGYYTYSAVSRDAAGNSSAAVTRVIAVNATVPALTTALFNVPLTGPSALFNANASTNFDIWNSTYTMAYAGANLAAPVQPAVVLYTPAVLNGFNGTQLFSNVAAGITINGFIRQMELVATNGPLTTGGGFKPSQLTGIVRDQANVASLAANTPIPGASVTNGVLYTAAGATLLTRSWAITNAATNVSTGGTTPAANALSVTLNADVFGPTATYNPPFSRVDFFVVVGLNLEQIGSTTALSTFDDGSAFGRRHRYSITWTPGTASPISATAWTLGAQNVYAIGVSANGDGLVTLSNALITITNP